ncbi:thiol-disulfide oxidoreductase DCC family protein [Oryzobacter telluris]|uniref:thiol-disulfide oxidoreductase DCC family protein n=1 Tax=Oryzobacter telluris TaxID=3149179 RepID=UPI00370D8E94
MSSLASPTPSTDPSSPVLPVLPVLVFDGDCAFCSTSARVLTGRLRRSPDDFAVEPWQHLDLAALGLTPEACLDALQWVDASGQVSAGHRAVGKALLASRWWVRPAGAVLLAPGVGLVAAPAYRWVSRNRHRLPGGTPACGLPAPPPAA